MNKIGFILFLSSVTLVLLLSVVPPFVSGWADGPDGGRNALACSDMPEFQISGQKAGSACRVPVVVIGEGIRLLNGLYRSVWTHRTTSESDSDLVEDIITVDAFLYYWLQNQWNLE